MAIGETNLLPTMSHAMANGVCHVEDKHEQKGQEGQVQQLSAVVAAAALAAAAKQQHKNQQQLQRQQRAQKQEEDKEEEVVYGRGKRKIKHLTVTINGDQVKVANNYTVTGAHYVYDNSRTGAYYRPTVRKQGQKKKPATDAPPRILNPILRALQERNHKVAAQKAITDARRDTFLRGHLSGLRPFISDEVAARLASVAVKPTEPGATMAATAGGGGSDRKGNRSAKKEDGPPKLSKQPSCIVGTELRDYQLQGLNFLLDRHHHGVPMILGDEMGLGKTLQSLSFLAYLRFELGIVGPALVVCPLSVLSSWMNEAKKWCPQLRVVQLHTSDITERKRQCREILPRGDYDVCVTTYDMVKNPVARHALLRQIRWSTLVLDEGHIVKAETTEIAQTVRKIHFGNVLLLTGTPLQNNLHELWSLLNFLMPDIFDEDSGAIFDSSFDWKKKTVDPQRLQKAHALLQVFMLRRLKVDVEKGLPPRVETKVYCPLSEMQLFYYKLLLLKDADVVARLEDDNRAGGGKEGGKKQHSVSGTDWKRMQMLMTQLRKASSHPFLFKGAEGETEATVDEMVEASGKLQTLDRLLVKLKKAGHRCVIFSQWKHTLDILDDFLRGRGYRYTRLDGATNRIRRIINIDAFNAPESPLFAFLMTTRAGGLGVNLQTADTVILFDSDWNPQPDLQAMARVHRIGQKKCVHVYRLISFGTIEERILEHAEKKLFLAEHVNRDSLAGKETSSDPTAAEMGNGEKNGGGEVEKGRGKGRPGVDPVPEDLDSESILAHLTFGSDAVAHLEGNELLDDASLDMLIDRTRGIGEDKKSTVGGVKKEGGVAGRKNQITNAKKDAATFDATVELTNTRVLQGVMYESISRPISSLNDIAAEWATQNEKRKREQRVVMVQGLGTGYGMAAVPVLKDNDYDLGGGETSVFDRELKGRAAIMAYQDKKRFVLTAGRDFQHEDSCANCWDGGEIVLCSHCPSGYHFSCLGLGKGKKNNLPALWSCPQHRCAECNRNATAAGGVIFRCLACPSSFCYDHKPQEAVIVAHNPRFEALGYPDAQHTAFVLCSPDCAQFYEVFIKKLPPPEASIYPMD